MVHGHPTPTCDWCPGCLCPAVTKMPAGCLTGDESPIKTCGGDVGLPPPTSHPPLFCINWWLSLAVLTASPGCQHAGPLVGGQHQLDTSSASSLLALLGERVGPVQHIHSLTRHNLSTNELQQVSKLSGRSSKFSAKTIRPTLHNHFLTA